VRNGLVEPITCRAHAVEPGARKVLSKARGRRSLDKATVAVRAIELRMPEGVTEAEQSAAFRLLQCMIHSPHEGHGAAVAKSPGAPTSIEDVELDDQLRSKELLVRVVACATPEFTIGKNADLSGPSSPVVTSDELGDDISDPGLRVTTHVNGELMQAGNTRALIHTVERIIAHITDTITLRPGDVIATGTPGGVGAGRMPRSSSAMVRWSSWR
jgi:fumarylacetoacetase-like protein